MRGPVRTGFAWVAAPDEPFIVVSWCDRRGRFIEPRGIRWGRVAVIVVCVTSWGLFLSRCGVFA